MKGYAPIVRPWLKAGLNALLLEDEARVLELRAVVHDAQCDSTEGQKAGRTPQLPPRPAKMTAAPKAPCSLPQRTADTPPDAKRERQKEAALETQAVRTPVRNKGMHSLLAAPGALPVDSWPASWRALKDRRPLPSRPLVLWTYGGLGEDLIGVPDESRRRVIVRMLTELRHPAGTHVFWPFSLKGEGLAEDASLFWSGVSFLDPRVVLLFGSDTRDALNMPKSLLPFCQDRVHGRLIIQLPRPQALAADESAFRQTQAFLARILSFCARR